MIVRREQPGNAQEIHAVHVACFPTDAESRLVDRLRVSGRLMVSLVAEVGGEIAGHVAFSPVTVSSGTMGIGLAPVAVLESHRRQGIAAKLIQTGLDVCRDTGFGWAVVLGDPVYYSRFGFRPAFEFGLSDAYHGGGAFQALELIPGQMPVNSGLVQYDPAFAMFE